MIRCLHKPDALGILLYRDIHHRVHEGTTYSFVLGVRGHRDGADASDPGTQIDEIDTDYPMILFGEDIIKSGSGH
jgi:hypothetical protein